MINACASYSRNWCVLKEDFSNILVIFLVNLTGLIIMEEALDIGELLSKLLRDNTTPEELVDRAIRNLYYVESKFMFCNNIGIRNTIRSTIAYVKLLYDFGQQMLFARLYLLHRVKLLEVRERDSNLELSMVRGLSSSGEDPSFKSNVINDSINKNLKRDDSYEPEIVFDARMINEIDNSQAALDKISKKIANKRRELLDIEKKMDNASSSIMTLSTMKTELINFQVSDRAEHTLDLCLSCSSRDGDSRIMSPIDTNMEMSLENDGILLSQGEIGAPRDRQGGEPDAAGSESSKGTAGAVSASALVAKDVTAEISEEYKDGLSHIDTSQDDLPHVEDTLPLVAREKRKASISPNSEVDVIGAHRHTKARIVESTDVEMQDGEENIPVGGGSELDMEEAASAKLPSSSPENRGITKRSLRNSGVMADFSALKASREKKRVRDPLAASNSDDRMILSDNEVGSDKPDSLDGVDEFVKPIVERIQGENAGTDLEDSADASYVESSRSSRSHRAKKTNLGSSKYVELSTDSEDDTIYCKPNKGRKKNKTNTKTDKALKNPLNKSKRKTSLPEVVTKDETEKELRYSREDWLNLDGADLGSRCLDYLAELDRQRGLCGNLSGQVAGRMKDSRLVAVEITKALIEKITVDGDVYGLRNENFSLREEINELRRKEQAQCKEIDSLRKTISNLERDVRSMKEGFVPFSMSGPPPAKQRIMKKQKSPEKKFERERERELTPKEREREIKSREKDITLKRQSVNVSDAMDVEPLVSNIPGCSTDDQFTTKRMEWSDGADSIFKTSVDSDAKVATSGLQNERRYKDVDNYLNLSSRVRASPRNRGPRVIENRQIVPPFVPINKSNSEWSVVGKRSKTVSIDNRGRNRLASSDSSRAKSNKRTFSGSDKVYKPAKRFVKPAVVTITSKPDGVTYAQILAKAREKVSLRELGIQNTVIRRAMNGAIVIEVPGPNGKQLASSLSSCLAEVLADDARVLNPVAMGELRLRGIDPSTTMEEIREELERLCGCGRQDFRVSPISVMRDGMGVAWITCPLEFAAKIAEKGVIALGWTRVKIELLKKRPVQCFRCWKFGHVRGNCRSEIDRKGSCFRCGLTGHTVGNCNAGAPRCVICEDLGMEFRHRMGTPRCLSNQGFPSGVQPIKRVKSDADGGNATRIVEYDR